MSIFLLHEQWRR